MEKERKIKIIAIVSLIIVVIGLTIGYAALSSSLDIKGTATVDPIKFGVRFENLMLEDNSKYTTINGNAYIDESRKSTAIDGINVAFKAPNDYVTYSVDIVNDGGVNVEISSFNVTGIDNNEFISYTLKYDSNNGNDVMVGDVINANSRKKVMLKIYYKDLDYLPEENVSLNLGFEITYVQSDTSDSSTGSGGNEEACTPYVAPEGSIKLGNTGEEFYKLWDGTVNGEEVVALLSKYNLNVGKVVTGYETGIPVNVTYGEDLSGEVKQGVIPCKEARGKISKISGDEEEYIFPWYGTTSFSENAYWYEGGKASNGIKADYINKFPSFVNTTQKSNYLYVYDENSSLYKYIEDYKRYLENKDSSIIIREARLLTYEEAVNLGCNGVSCDNAPSWLYHTTYWLGSISKSLRPTSGGFVAGVNSSGWVGGTGNDIGCFLGIRPVIIISKTDT